MAQYIAKHSPGFLPLLVAATFLLLVGSPGPAVPAAQSPAPLLMATTTSTDNTGLLDILAPAFEKATGIPLRWVAVGTGKALKLGKNCDVDLLLVHAPEAEEAFMAAGFGLNRYQVMHNDFVLVGPGTDPAEIRGMSPIQALRRISGGKSLFLSRGDNSGTHKKEKALWAAAGIEPPEAAPWYLQTGQGMLTTLTMAAEKMGYTLTDRGTWIRFTAGRSGNDSLAVLVQGDPVLFNQYSVITINPRHCPNTRTGPAARFSRWLLEPETQKMIGDFRLMGQPLFIPELP